MKERPLLFSGEMVRAILDGRKSQTRRVMNPQPTVRFTGDIDYWESGKHRGELGKSPISTPYGVLGDKLWVRETFYWSEDEKPIYRACVAEGLATLVNFNRERNGVKWTSAIHMPRWASRITLEIAEVRVERVQNISEVDAIAEGVTLRDDWLECSECTWLGSGDSEGVTRTEDEDWSFLCPECKAECAHCPMDEQARRTYRELWDSINAERDGGIYAWAKNPWVWAITFRRIP